MSATDVIVLSSAERPSAYTPRPPMHSTSDNAFELSPTCSSPISLMSPSELFKPSTRSKYFEPRRAGASQKAKSKEPKGQTRREDSATTNTKENSTGEKPKRGRKKPADERQAVAGDLETTDNANKKTSRPRKPRADNAAKRGESGNKKLKGRVAKAGDALAERENKRAVEPDSSTSKAQDDTKRQSGWEEDGLQLEDAMKRRLDWTPSKDTSKPVIELDDERRPDGVGFGNLLSGYNFNGTAVGTHRDYPQVTEDGGPTKKRRFELVTSKGPESSKSSLLDTASTDGTQRSGVPQGRKKQKAQSKRINTLTARVTAGYADDMDHMGPGEGEAVRNSRSVRNGKSRSKVKEPEFEILPPESATKALDEQGLVFGTCSQLEREDSPTTLRDTQLAIHASESSMSQEYQSRSEYGALSSLESGSAVSRSTAPRNLWSVAARDLDGSLVHAEALDLDISETPSASSRDDCTLAKGVEGTPQEKPVEVDSRDSLPREKTPVPNGKPTGYVEPSAPTGTNECNGTAESCPTMPQYGAFTYAELCSQIAAYGFKPLKSRQKMIDLLQKCWESKHGANSNDKPSSKPALSQSQDAGEKAQQTKSKTRVQTQTSSKVTSTDSLGNRSQKATVSRKPSARKQQKSATPPIEVEEIEDSEEEAIPSPRRPPTAAAQSLPVSTVSPRSPARGSSAATDPSRRTSLPDLGAQITKAVRAQPRSLSSACARPSWHEKILMYDPIVLEDFATWLNTEGLGLVGEDREVGAGFARVWCESKGICCCWRKGD
ncbi:hypothetical protein PHISP_05327 [Aspergillus sp. HF37]|nr:hypothetical protein PHISP_05327 [Aspergillus sp. HF37]